MSVSSPQAVTNRGTWSTRIKYPQNCITFDSYSWKFTSEWFWIFKRGERRIRKKKKSKWKVTRFIFRINNEFKMAVDRFFRWCNSNDNEFKATWWTTSFRMISHFKFTASKETFNKFSLFFVFACINSFIIVSSENKIIGDTWWQR